MAYPQVVQWIKELQQQTKVTAILGEIRLLPFRAEDLHEAAPGWYFCNGDQYALDSVQGAVLASFPDSFKADWGITVSGSEISLPNMFHTDGRGYFIRAADGTTRQAGSVADDQMRPIWGSFEIGGNMGLHADVALQGAFRATTSTGLIPLHVGGAGLRMEMAIAALKPTLLNAA